MSTGRALLIFVSLIATTACMPSTTAERRIERSFNVRPGSTVEVGLSGGRVTTVTGPAGIVSVSMRISVRGIGSVRNADRILSTEVVDITQEGNVVRVKAERNRADRGRWARSREISATITVPADVTLKLDTRGGSIVVRGERLADVLADTHGGSVDIETGRAGLVLSTAGGRIRIGRAFGTLQADTRGGSIDVDYISQTARDIVLGSAGGSIRVGIDPSARFSLVTSANGGGIHIEGLPFAATVAEHSQIEGTLNDGEVGQVRAFTRGGSITIRAASDRQRLASISPGHNR